MNKSARLKRSLVTTAMAIGTLYAGAWRVEADSAYIQTDLVSDIPGLAALTEPKLVNPWGFRIPPPVPFGLRTRVPVQPICSRSRLTSRKCPLRGATAISSFQQRQADLKAPPARSRIQLILSGRDGRR